jgi:hypothetical protein
MIMLELAGRFPPGADLHAAWLAGVSALQAQPSARTREPSTTPRPC